MEVFISKDEVFFLRSSIKVKNPDVIEDWFSTASRYQKLADEINKEYFKNLKKERQKCSPVFLRDLLTFQTDTFRDRNINKVYLYLFGENREIFTQKLLHISFSKVNPRISTNENSIDPDVKILEVYFKDSEPTSKKTYLDAIDICSKDNDSFTIRKLEMAIDLLNEIKKIN